MKFTYTKSFVNGLFLLFTTVSACKQKPAEVNEADQDIKKEYCYAYSKDSSEVSLKITVDDNKVLGSLIYHWKEKDNNSGTIAGEMKGDTLFAAYSFISEGLNGTRHVVFLRSDDSFIEGHGDIDPDSGQPDLSNRSHIDFKDGLKLSGVDCH